MKHQVLIISFWNPVETNPQQGIFIQDQAAAVCSQREDIIFLQVNVLHSKNIFLKTEIKESSFFRNRKITINLYTLLWKLWFVNPWLLAGILKRILRRHFPEIKPALIHSNVIFPCGIVAYLLAQKYSSELVISEHWSKAEKLLKHPLYGKTALKVYLKNHTVITVSKFLAARIEAATGHKNIKVIPNIVNTTLFSFKPKSISDGNNLVCTCVATWKPPKKLDLIIDSLALFVRESGKNIILNVVGEGPQTERLRIAWIPGNLRIIWHGYLDKLSIATLLQSSHLFLHASEIETFSIVTAEALSTGTPVLVSYKGALPELVHEKNGLLTENTVASWNTKICEIINKIFDNELIAQENQARFSAETIAGSILEVYNKVFDNIE